MSSAIVLPKNKINPLNLTSQTVHQMLKQVPNKTNSQKKLYPTAKYATQDIRSHTQVNSNIHNKIKQMDRIYSQSKRVRLKADLSTHISDTNKQPAQRNTKFIISDKTKKKQAKIVCEDKIVMARQEQLNKKQEVQYSAAKRSSESYFNKINKIKSLKLKQYMKNKFAIQIKTIQTTRQDTSNRNDPDLNNVSKNKGHIDFNPTNNNININQIKSNYKSKILLKFNKEVQQKGLASNSYDFINQNDQKYLTQFPNHRIHNQQQNIHGRQLLALQKSLKTDKTQYKLKTKLIQKYLSVQKSNFNLTKHISEQSPADSRFTKMKYQLNLILNSFACTIENIPMQLPAYSRNCFKYKYYVGPGNNKNLIISVMKKRWWWTQTTCMSQADFVWTQIKQLKLFQQCKRSNSSCNILKIMDRTSCNLNGQGLKKEKQKNQQQYTKNNKLFHSRSVIRFEQANTQHQLRNRLKIINIPKKLHNHYIQNSMIGNKKALFYHVSAYCQYKKLNRYDYIPLTFHIADQKSVEVKNLQKAYAQNPGSYWIIKPGENTNRGHGISVTKSLNEIRQKIKTLSNRTLIIQRYIDDLFLYNLRKFDIRAYMIAITIGGSTKFYWHNQGYIRTSSYIFNLKNYDDVFVHLTNDAIQCESQNYSKYQQGNKLSYQQFQRYLDANYYNKKYSIKNAHQQMKNIAKLVAEAVYPQINKSNIQYTFQLFGLDFILDNDLKPWLIQVNTNPCLQLCAPALHRLIPQVIENTFRLALDPVFQPCVQFPRSMSSFVCDNIIPSNRFELIFDDLFDRDYQWQKKILPQQLSIFQEDQQQHQGDGQILQNV